MDNYVRHDLGMVDGAYHLWRYMLRRGSVAIADDVRRLCELNVAPLKPDASEAEINQALKEFSAMKTLGAIHDAT